MADFLSMGGYAPFVWPAWAAGIIAIGGITLATYRRLGVARRTLTQMEKQKSKKAKANG